MHTDETLKIFDGATVQIGSEFRTFNKRTCPAFDTRELRREMNARKRRQLKQTIAKKSSIRDEQPVPDSTASEVGGPLPRSLNIQTYKYHALGDYPDTIRELGTTDSFSTEPVSVHLYSASSVDTYIWQSELEHRDPKSGYKRTDRKSFVKQLTQIERRKARIRRIRAKILEDGGYVCDPEEVASTPLEHHHIGLAQNRYEHIGTFLRKHTGDPAVQV